MAIHCKKSIISGRVSVVMPCFNAELYIQEAVESVLAQSYPNIELIVVDDGSTDNSLEVLAQYGERIHVLHQEQGGPAVARNTGIEYSSGEFIAFLDADDYWEPDCVQRLYEGFEDSKTVLAYCGWQNVGAMAKNSTPFIPSDYENKQKLEALLKNAALWPIHAALTRRSALEEVGGFDTRWRECEDYDLWLRLTATRKIKLVPYVLAYYRHHKDLRATDKRGRDAEALWRIKREFIKEFPDQVADLDKDVLRDCVDGGLRRRGFQCYWNGELQSARRIFRRLLRTGYFEPKDLKYLLAAILPEPIFLAAVSQRRAGNC